jgi:hypothetical protein
MEQLSYSVEEVKVDISDVEMYEARLFFDSSC